MAESGGSSETETRYTRGRSAPSLCEKRGSDEGDVVHELSITQRCRFRGTLTPKMPQVLRGSQSSSA
jgi:hypothetical protein